MPAEPKESSEPSFTGSEEETVKGDVSPFFNAEAQAPAASQSIVHSVPQDRVIGTEVGGYVVKRKIGSGGMGIVYEGEQTVIGKKVALKVLRAEVADNPEVVKRLVAEARAVNAVGHRNIIDVFNFATLPDGRQCIIMELLEGESLEQILLEHKNAGRLMPVNEVLIILDEVLAALAAAHAAGVIHRDLKPSNIFLCRQRDGTRFVKLLDFGIAKLGVLGDATHNASLMVGTPSYMAPEQANSGAVKPALDLYAVGVLAFEMLTGRLPFKEDSIVQLLLKHAHEPPPKPQSLVMSIPDELDELVLKLLAKKPEDRPASADEVRADIIRMQKHLFAKTAERPSQPELRAQSLGEVDDEEDTAVSKPRPALMVAPNANAADFDDDEVTAKKLSPRVEAKKQPEAKPGDETIRRVEVKTAPPDDATLPPKTRAPQTSSKTAQTSVIPKAVREKPAPKSNTGLWIVFGALLLLLAGLVAFLLTRP